MNYRKSHKKEKEKEEICVMNSKARKTICLMQPVKEAKVKDFAILFLVLLLLHQGNHLWPLVFRRAH